MVDHAHVLISILWIQVIANANVIYYIIYFYFYYSNIIQHVEHIVNNAIKMFVHNVLIM